MGSEAKKGVNMKSNDYIIGKIENGKISISDYYSYSDIIIARKEAEIKAKNNKNCEFVVLKIEGICKSADVTWK